MIMQAERRCGQGNQCLDVISLSPTSERKFGGSGRGERIIKSEVGRECFNCGKTGHMDKDCRTAPACVRCGKVVGIVN